MNRKPRRSGTILVLALVTIPTLLVMAALVIDGGRMLARRQSLQDAADAGAKTAAHDLIRGGEDLTGAAALVLAGYGLSASEWTVNSPPTEGAYAGMDNYVEVVIEADFVGVFNGALSGGTISTRATAGYELIFPDDLVTVLDMGGGADSGLSVKNGLDRLSVEGSVVVNSLAGGLDEYGDTVSGDSTYPAVRGPGDVSVKSISVAGGVEDLSTIANYSAGPNPLDAGVGVPFPDPYIHTPTPTIDNGVVNVLRGAPEAVGNTISLNNPDDDSGEPNYVQYVPTGHNSGYNRAVLRPGIYEQILLRSGSHAYFQPGVYVLRRGDATVGETLAIEANSSVIARGVMFYATSPGYDPATGAPDAYDGYEAFEDDASLYGEIKIVVDSGVFLTPIDSAAYTYSTPVADEFQNMLFYKRRRNNHDTQIVLSSGLIGGVIYTQRSKLLLRGNGNLFSTLVVATLEIDGKARLYSDGPYGAKAPAVVLVE